MSTFIGDLAERLGLNVKTIRYYEELGLLSAAPRSESGYRLYTDEHEAQLRFIQGAKALGLSLAEIGEIMEAWRHGEAPCDHVGELLERKLDDLDRRIQDLITFRDSLRAYKDRVDGLERASNSPCKHIAGVASGAWLPPVDPPSPRRGRPHA